MGASDRKQQGFTIIEVVLVLAIAGLIFLMVFVALPALQRGQRDLQRKGDLSRISVQMTNYLSSTRGSAPTTDQALQSFVTGYLGGGSGKTAGDEYKDPNGVNYTFKFGTAPSEVGQIGYFNKKACATDGSGGVVDAGATRNFALVAMLEGQTAAYCIDNKS